MSVTVNLGKVDVSKASGKARLIRAAAQSAAVLAARRDCEPYVPYVMGALRGSAETESQPRKALLKYGSAAVPYARAQYYGCPRKTWPGTTMRWFEAAKGAYGAVWIKEAELAAREATGK